MLTNDDLELLSNLIDKKFDEKLAPIQNDISQIKEDIEEIKFQANITRESSNAACEWIEKFYKEFLPDFPIPVDKKKEEII